jgi:hypothetical protein
MKTPSPKSQKPSKGEWLFPIAELKVLKLPNLTIYHRRKSVIQNKTSLGPTDEFCVMGLGVSDDPSTLDGERERVGLFEFKGEHTSKGDIQIQSESALRWIMAGVVLGERFAKYQRKDGVVEITRGRMVGEKKPGLIQAEKIWRMWRVWIAEPFQKHCKDSLFLPLINAVDSLKLVGVQITPEALKKHLQRLKLPF